jgi:hypothetical protein
MTTTIGRSQDPTSEGINYCLDALSTQLEPALTLSQPLQVPLGCDPASRTQGDQTSTTGPDDAG